MFLLRFHGTDIDRVCKTRMLKCLHNRMACVLALRNHPLFSIAINVIRGSCRFALICHDQMGMLNVWAISINGFHP